MLQRDDLDVTVDGQLTLSSADIAFIGSESDLNIAHFTSAGNAEIKTNGDLSDTSSDQNATIVTGKLVLEAGIGAIGTQDRPIQMTLSEGATLTARAENSIHLFANSNDVNINTIYSRAGSVSLATAAGSLTDDNANDFANIKAGDSIVLRAIDGAIGAVDNPLEIDAGATAYLHAEATNDIVVEEVLGNMNVQRASSGEGDVVLVSHLSMLDANPGFDKADIEGDFISLTAKVGGIGQAGDEIEIDSSIFGTGGLEANSKLLDININEILGDLNLYTIETGENSTAFLAALDGRIINGLTAPDATNVLSGKAYLFASHDIGESAKPIASQMGMLQAKSTQGCTYLTNSGALSIAPVLSTSSLGVESACNVVISASSPITIASSVNAGGDIILDAHEEAGIGDDITITESGSLQTTGGKIVLRAGDEVRMLPGSRLAAQSIIEISGAYLDVDQSPLEMSFAGTLDAPFINIQGSEFADQISITDTASVQGVVVIEGAGGTDRISNAAENDYENPVIMFGDYVGVSFDEATATLFQLESVQPGIGSPDILSNLNGMALMVGGIGQDTITGGIGADWAVGDDARIVFTDNRIQKLMTLHSETGDVDFIDVGDGENYVIAGVGADEIAAGIGTNTILGDEGQVFVNQDGGFVSAESLFASIGDADLFSLAEGTYRIIAGVGDETINLGAGRNMVIGDAGYIREVNDGNSLIGSLGESVSGNDTISTQDGYNVIIGGNGSDDILVKGSSPDAITIVLGDSGFMTV
ncbi:hypothetical protein N9D23_15655, partial [Rubripirellula sp.]|nr:hypothetical protein [Rubripirellula sp.]